MIRSGLVIQNGPYGKAYKSSYYKPHAEWERPAQLDQWGGLGITPPSMQALRIAPEDVELGDPLLHLQDARLKKDLQIVINGLAFSNTFAATTSVGTQTSNDAQTGGMDDGVNPTVDPQTGDVFYDAEEGPQSAGTEAPSMIAESVSTQTDPHELATEYAKLKERVNRAATLEKAIQAALGAGVEAKATQVGFDSAPTVATGVGTELTDADFRVMEDELEYLRSLKQRDKDARTEAERAMHAETEQAMFEYIVHLREQQYRDQQALKELLTYGMYATTVNKTLHHHNSLLEQNAAILGRDLGNLQRKGKKRVVIQTAENAKKNKQKGRAPPPRPIDTSVAKKTKQSGEKAPVMNGKAMAQQRRTQGDQWIPRTSTRINSF